MRLGDFLKQNAQRVLQAWEAQARATQPAQDMERSALIDQLPRLLDDFSCALASADRPTQSDVADKHADEHAAERLDQGFKISQMVRELGQLRSCILQLWRDSHPSLTIDDAQQLTSLVDRAVERAVDRYVERRVRLTAAFEKIATAALDVDELNPFLHRLLTVFMEVAPSMDSAAILLRDGDRLIVRAAIGLEREARSGFSMEMGEGFSGIIAASKQPKEISSAWADPLVKSPSLHERKTMALYGVPLVDGSGEVIGVAHIGTREASEIPSSDKRLFGAVAQRAASAIVKHGLRVEARRRFAELSAVIEAIPGEVYLADHTHRLTMANGVGLRSLGFRNNAELRGADLAVLGERVDARDATTFERLLVEDLPISRALRGESGVFDVVTRDVQTGRLHYLRSHAGAVMDEGNVIGAVIVATDISELHRAMEEMKRTAEFRERFIAIVSHDLRNPLQAIGASASILVKSSALAPELAKPVGRILSNVERMAGMISDLLDFTRGRLGGGIPVEPTTVDLSQVARRVVENLEEVHPKREIVYTAQGNLVGQWDAERLAQLVANLVGNALVHGAPDRPIRVTVDGAETAVTLSVSNAGPEIPAELLPYIFDPFRRAEDERRRAGGLGLGLFIASEVVRAHRGRIEVRSNAQGTMFTVTLPRQATGSHDPPS
jgi:signal transduction histidine kinase